MSAPTGPIGNYAPLVKYEPYRRQGVDASGMAGLQQMRQRQDEIQRQKEEQATQQLLQFAQDPDVDLRAVAPAVSGLTMQGFQLAEEVQRVAGEKRVRQEKIQDAVSTLQEAIPLGAGRLNEQGLPVAADPRAAALSKRAEEQALQSVEQVRPERVAQVQQMIALQRMAAEQDLLGKSAEVRREPTRLEEKEMLSNWGTQLAGQAMGMMPKTDLDAEIRDYAGPDRAPALMVRAHNEGKAQLIHANMQIKTTKIARMTDFDREVAAWQSEFGYTKQEAVLRARDKVFDDPVTGRVLPKVSVQYQEQRYALNELINSVEPLRDSAIAAAKAGAERGALIGPVVGAPGIQEMSRFFALQDPAVADYELQYRNFTSRMLKAIQGSRPSDFDLRFYLGLLPMLTELTMTPEGDLNPAAQQRLATMEQMLRRSSETPFDKKLGMKANRLRSQEWSPEDKTAMRILKQYNNGEIDIGQFTEEISAWREGRGHKFIPDAARAKPATSNPVDLYLSGP